jgi:hypothetical protein
MTPPPQTTHASATAAAPRNLDGEGVRGEWFLCQKHPLPGRGPPILDPVRQDQVAQNSNKRTALLGGRSHVWCVCAVGGCDGIDPPTDGGPSRRMGTYKMASAQLTMMHRRRRPLRLRWPGPCQRRGSPGGRRWSWRSVTIDPSSEMKPAATTITCRHLAGLRGAVVLDVGRRPGPRSRRPPNVRGVAARGSSIRRGRRAAVGSDPGGARHRQLCP